MGGKLHFILKEILLYSLFLAVLFISTRTDASVRTDARTDARTPNLRPCHAAQVRESD